LTKNEAPLYFQELKEEFMDTSKLVNLSSLGNQAKDVLPMVNKYLPQIKHYWWVGAIVIAVLLIGFAVYHFFIQNR